MSVSRDATRANRRIVERTLDLAMKVDGSGIAVPEYVTRIRFSSRELQRRDSGSQVLLTAGPIRQRVATADAPHSGDLRLALGVGTPTLPPFMPTVLQDDGRSRLSAELFIVLRSAPRGDVRPPTLARLLSTQRVLAEAEHHAREALADLFVGSIPRHGPIHSHAWR